MCKAAKTGFVQLPVVKLAKPLPATKASMITRTKKLINKKINWLRSKLKVRASVSPPSSLGGGHTVDPFLAGIAINMPCGEYTSAGMRYPS